jgi:lipoate-protein ligase A
MARTGELLEAVDARRSPATVRIFRPGPTVAFGRQDSFQSGFDRARHAARMHRFEPVVRHAGGHAVAYDADSVVVEVVRPEDQLFGGIEQRFEALSTLIQTALEQLGVELELGQLPDEYCPGRFSLHLPSGPKVAGLAQRVIRRASLTTGVIAVAGGDRLRAVTVDVYEALGLPLDVDTVGAIADRHPAVTAQAVADALADLAPELLGELTIQGSTTRRRQ